MDPEYYDQLIAKWEGKTKNSYFNYFKKEIQLFRSIHFSDEKESRDNNWLAYFLFALLIGEIAYILFLRKKNTQINDSNNNSELNKLDLLSKKEKEVIELMLKEMSNKEIAQTLFIETNTVKSHITKIYQKLEVNSRQELLNTYKYGH